jgi:uncharacterized protein with ParB-like and HNH nuclease domain
MSILWGCDQMSTSEQMEELSVADIIERYNLIIPEIQREYVWGNNDYDILDLFLLDIRDKANTAAQVDAALLDASHSVNIGFLYSYLPDYDKENDVYLIDGQQRFTTIFLSLLYFALKENKLQSFLNHFKYNPTKEIIAFDYRVRNITHQFMFDLLEHTKTLPALLAMEQKTWFLNDYASDLTISAMIKTIKKLDEYFGSAIQEYFEFLLYQVKFWHFKTEATSQGEELYITMNSRGRALVDNETLRAKLFEKIKDSNQTLYWGIKWEEWQDFFWKNRGDNENADKGFKEFLRCISALEQYIDKDKQKQFCENEDFLSKGIRSHLILEFLDFETIDKYFKCYEYLVKHVDTFKTKYAYYKWVDKSIEEILGIFNDVNTNWFADYSHDNRGTERRRMAYIWSILLYLSKVGLGQVDIDKLYRVLRLYYVRYHNQSRSVTNISTNIENIIKGRVWELKQTTEDESQKHQFLLKCEDDVRAYEEIIWEIEDHELNLRGNDLGLVNITHLVDFSTIETPNDLKVIKDKFYELFPYDKNKKDQDKLKTLLLYYGKYWHQVRPWGYENYHFGDWKRIIRNLDGDKNVFKQFFEDFKNKDLDLLEKEWKNKFMDQIKAEIHKMTDVLHVPDFRSQLIIYSLLTDIWLKGDYIAIKGLVNDGETRLFSNEEKIIYNSKGDLRGISGNMELWEQVKDTFIEKLQKLIQTVPALN